MIRITSDGGRTWRTVYEATWQIDSMPFQLPLKPYGAAFCSPTTIIVACDSGSILRSTDAGETWNRMQLADSSVTFNQIDMYDEALGIVSAWPGVFLRTTNGGSSWSRIALPSASSSRALVDAMHLSRDMLIGLLQYKDSTIVIRSSNDGVSWEMFPGPAHVMQLRFVDTLRGWSCGRAYTGRGYEAYDVISHTSDGGRTWRTQLHELIDPEFGLNDIAFNDSLHGIAVGQSGKILRTTDGGEQWFLDENPLYRPAVPQVVSISFPLPGFAIAVTNIGNIIRYDNQPSGIGGELRRERNNPLVVAPNPLEPGAELAITCTLPVAGYLRLHLADMLGATAMNVAEVWAEPGRHDYFIPTGNLPAGTYFLTLIGPAEQRHVIPVVVR